MKDSNNSSTTHHGVEPSTTLNRHYVKRPVAYTNYQNESSVSQPLDDQKQQEAILLRQRQARAEEINRQNLARLNRARKTAQTSPQGTQVSNQPSPANVNNISVTSPASALAEAAKTRATDAALQTAALESVATSSTQETSPASTKKSFFQKSPKTLSDKKSKGRFALAFAASAACVIALGLIVKANMPDLSVRVAAMQTGIEATYPSYIPAGYQLAGVSTGKNDSITMDFTGPTESAHFSITEEASAWDSNALLNNYVKETWGTDYVVVREQGITIYLSNSDATWVNGGLLYHLSAPAADTLSKKEIKNIVTSL